MDYSNDFNLKFLELYKSEPCIWDPHHPEYKNKKHVSDAWLRISAAIGEKVEDLKRRKESLMSTYRKMRKKTSMRTGEDEIYKPIWYAYELMESFLGRISVTMSMINTQETISPPNSLGPEDSEDEALFSISGVSSNQTSKRMKIRHRKSPSISQDECDLFGKMIAKKLRQLPEHERDSVMYEILGIFVNWQAKNLTTFFDSSTTTMCQDIILPSDSSTSVSYSLVKDERPEETLDEVKEESIV